MRTLKKLLLGETWTLPIGLAATLVAAALLSGRLTGLALLAGAALTLIAAVSASTRRR